MGAELSTLAPHCRSINELLEDETLVRELARRTKLSIKAKRNISLFKNVTGREPQASEASRSRRDVNRPIWQLRSQDIGLPENLKEVYSRWKDNVALFFEFDPRGSHVPSGSILAQRYASTARLQIDQHADTILWRFLMVFYYDLSEHEPQITEKRLMRITKIIQQSGANSDDTETIKTNIRRWRNFGARFHAMTIALGGNGCLFVLPTLSNYQIQQRFPIKGPKFEAIAERFKDLAIAERIALIDGHELGARIRNRALSCLQEARNDNGIDPVPGECAMMITAQSNNDLCLPQNLGGRVTTHVEEGTSISNNEPGTEQSSRRARSHPSDEGTLSTEVPTAQTDTEPLPMESMNFNPCVSSQTYLPTPWSYGNSVLRSSHAGLPMADNQALCASAPTSTLFSFEQFPNWSEQFSLFDIPMQM